ESGFDDQLIPVIRKALKALIWSLGLIIGLDNIGFDITAMIAGLGIGGLALALAAQDSVKNIFAGVMIFLDKPFKLKDRIQISEFDGTVEEVGIRSTRIRTLEGRIVTIPNCTFTDNSVINVSSQPALKVKINLGLTYDTNENDMQKAIDILEDIVKNQEAITDDYSAGFNGFGDFSLNILFMYYVKPESHWLDTQTLVNKEILKRFNEEKLDFAFPTQTILKKEI
ncbi:MAG: mechanosensitive ion channel family protein, partial [Bacteroidota bacterium]|nr:mechanosensitive ion channel family protein [Bacteroidota bacterium]